MGQTNLPPDEDWWERKLLKEEKDPELARAGAERCPGGATAAWDGPAALWGLELRDPEFAPLAMSAHEFTRSVLGRGDLPDGYEMLRSAASKLSAHLAGGHAPGYDDAVLCGHIVKCRWALSECRFCEESLAHIVRRLGRPEFAGLLDRSRSLARAIEERIDLLRERVWW